FITNNFYKYFFFFQAEDGIRDRTVTGVQTCALPISPLAHLALHIRWRAIILDSDFAAKRMTFGQLGLSPVWVNNSRMCPFNSFRSEERRVGKSVDIGGRGVINKKRVNRGRIEV